jgi:hypothetical protein
VRAGLHWKAHFIRAFEFGKARIMTDRMGCRRDLFLIASQLVAALKASDIPAVVVLLLIQVAAALRARLKPEHNQIHHWPRVLLG